MTDPLIPIPSSMHPRLRDLFSRPDHILPPFRQSIVKLLDLVSTDTTSLQELSHIIINDPGLSSRILRLTNSFAYSPLAPITSIHHAVVWLGLNTLRTTIGTIKLLDDLLPSIKHSPSLMRLVAASIIAATQASELGDAIEFQDIPTLYTHTLLYHMVDMMLVYQAPELYDALMAIQHTQQRILTGTDELHVLGVTRRRYGELLTQLWHLPGDYLTRAHNGHHPLETLPPSPWTTLIAQHTGLIISTNLLATEITGNNDRTLINTLQSLIQAGCRLSPTHTERLLTTGTEKGHRVLRSTGLSQFLHVAQDAVLAIAATDDAVARGATSFQAATAHSQDINELLKSFIQALQTTLAFTRIALALLDPHDPSRLIGRYVIGADPQRHLPPLTGSLHKDHPLFLTILKRADPMLISNADVPLRSQFSPSFIEVWRPGACLLGPLSVDRRAIGLIYADFGPSSAFIPAKILTHYHLFSIALSKGLTRLTQR